MQATQTIRKEAKINSGISTNENPTIPVRDLEYRVEKALETYSGVHRGNGCFSEVTTKIYEYSREIILAFLKLNPEKYLVVFCSGYASKIIEQQLPSNSLKILKSNDLGLPFGLYAVAIRKSDLTNKVHFLTGGGVARMVSHNYIIWANQTQKFEAGTPPVIHAIAMAAAIQIIQKNGAGSFRDKNGSASVQELFYDFHPEKKGQLLFNELENTRMGLDIKVPSVNGLVPYLHFDGAASTQTFTSVWKAVKTAWQMPVSMHNGVISEVKNILSGFLDASLEEYEMIFTGNTTESVNICAQMLQHEFDDNLVVVNTIMEHNSNELPWRNIPGAQIIRMPVDSEGYIDTLLLEHILKQHNTECHSGKKRIRLISITGASNVLGTYNDLKAVSTLAHKYGARILVDAAQMIAHRPIYMENWGIDYLVFSGHKVYAPFGSGVLIIRKNLINENFSSLEGIMKSGKENISGIVAIGKAISLLQRTGMELIEEKERILTSRMLQGLATIKDVTVFGTTDPHSPKLIHKGGIIAFKTKNMRHPKISGLVADYGGIGLRFGCFCTHMFIKHLLKASKTVITLQYIMFNIAPRLSNMIPGLMRVSISIGNRPEDVDHFITVLKGVVESERKYQANSILQQKEDFYESRLKMVFTEVV